MGVGILFKHLRAFVFQRIISHKLAGLSAEHCVILTYHRILPKSEVTVNVEPGMYVTPATLRTHILFLKSYFDVISVKQAEDYFVGTADRKSNKPCCVITFDDGWRDFYTYAWPVLQEENVPTVVYLPTALIGSDKSFWTDRLGRVLAQAHVSVLASQFDDRDWEALRKVSSRERQLSRAIELLKVLPYQRIEKVLDICECESGITDDSHGRTFMSWDEVRELSATGLVSFGSHTVNHAILTTLEAVEVQGELMASKHKLLEENVVRKGSISFCYPNGNYTREIARQVAGAGYSSAMTCDFGWNLRSVDSLLSLKRISVHQDISSTAYLFAYRLVQGL